MKIFHAILLIVVLFSSRGFLMAEPFKSMLSGDPEQLKDMLIGEQDDQVKLEIYYALYQAYRNSDPERAMDYLERQRIIAESLSDYFTLGKTCYNLGLLYENQKDNIEAVDWYLRAVDYFNKIGDVQRISTVFNNIGVVFMETGNFEYAKKFFEKTRHIYLQSNGDKKQVISSLNLGICNFSQEDPDYVTAKRYFLEAVSIAECLQNKKSYYLNRIYNCMGAMNYKKGDYEKAKQCYLKSLNYIDSIDKPSQVQFIAYCNIGEVEMGATHYKSAYVWMKRALDIAQNSTLESNLLIAGYNILGELFQKEENYQESAKALEEAISIADTTIINKPLQETLRLIRKSYKELNLEGRAVSADKYDNILELDSRQDKIEKKFIEKDFIKRTNLGALEAALGLKIELDSTKKAKQEEAKLKTIFIVIAVLLCLLVFFITYKLRLAKFKLNKADFKINLAKDIINS